MPRHPLIPPLAARAVVTVAATLALIILSLSPSHAFGGGGGGGGDGATVEDAMQTGHAIFVAQLDRALFYGYHVPGLLTNYTVADLAARPGWEVSTLPSRMRPNGETLVARRRWSG